MTDSTDPHGQMPELDTFLREVLPEVKLALGEVIDRENTRALPARYARLLPETLLVITLRPDMASELTPLAQTIERDLTDSVLRHGSLYDRSYRVQLRRSEDANAPIYRVTAHAGHEPALDSGLSEPAPARVEAQDATEFAPAALPVSDPDATRLDTVGPPGWQPGRWVLMVQNLDGEEREVFRLTDPLTTVGRRSDDPQLRSTVALRDVPHVSRRQLALRWEERGGLPGFVVYNLGLNPVHLPDRNVAGAHLRRGALDLDGVPEASTGWLAPGVPLRIGDQGPVLRIEEVPDEPDAVEEDPDATRYE
jgi:hypothetical protein